MKALYIAWQDRENRRWVPVGRLTFDGELYEFCYTKGSLASTNFVPFGRMTELRSVYRSKQLFPLFSNRILTTNRPEFGAFIGWLNLKETEVDPFVILSLTGGLRGTDNLEIFPCPSKTNENMYVTRFFDHGLSHMSEAAINEANKLSPGDKLFLMHDLQNPFDRWALALRTEETSTVVGYCPRYFAKDFHALLQAGTADVSVTVEKVNLDAPLQFRLLCKLAAPWRSDFVPCADENYQTIAVEQQFCYCS